MDEIALIKSRDPAALQAGLGMMRVAELQAIAAVARHVGAAAYVSMGCGSGFDFLSLRENYREVPAIGFDVCDVSPENVYPGVEFHREGIFQLDGAASAADRFRFKPEVHAKISGFLARHPGPTLFYTDNGLKIEELREILPYVGVGDAVGTHDWGIDHVTPVGTYAEVLERECGFLYAAGLVVLEAVEPWVRSHHCLQRFWTRAC